MKIKTAEINIEATEHRPQDALRHDSFVHEGRTVYCGAVSDGCTSNDSDPNWHPELGARWLVKEFCRQTKLLYSENRRGADLVRSLSLGMAKAMLDYQPKNPKTRQSKAAYCDASFSEELTATLFGYVLDHDNCTFLFAGEGVLLINGRRITMEQKTGDLYPVYFLDWPETDWEKIWESVFSWTEIPTEQLSSFGIASDGLKGSAEDAIKNCHRDPRKMMKTIRENNEKAVANSNRPDERPFTDDVSLIAVAINDGNRSLDDQTSKKLDEVVVGHKEKTVSYTTLLRPKAVIPSASPAKRLDNLPTEPIFCSADNGAFAAVRKDDGWLKNVPLAPLPVNKKEVTEELFRSCFLEASKPEIGVCLRQISIFESSTSLYQTAFVADIFEKKGNDVKQAGQRMWRPEKDFSAELLTRETLANAAVRSLTLYVPSDQGILSFSLSDMNKNGVVQNTQGLIWVTGSLAAAESGLLVKTGDEMFFLPLARPGDKTQKSTPAKPRQTSKKPATAPAPKKKAPKKPATEQQAAVSDEWQPLTLITTADFCEQNGIDLRARTEMLSEVRAAVKSAHQNGKAVGAVTPENTLFRFKDGYYEIRFAASASGSGPCDLQQAQTDDWRQLAELSAFVLTGFSPLTNPFFMENGQEEPNHEMALATMKLGYRTISFLKRYIIGKLKGEIPNKFFKDVFRMIRACPTDGAQIVIGQTDHICPSCGMA